ncbi:glycosyltransferase family 39 protein [Lewinella sp. LCG006]|uniref:glycosyltransferase family 39 protein n=1 Tax=Lewinella sp. LCG006 TaxID=3231911 RepID=UPI00345FD28E
MKQKKIWVIPIRGVVLIVVFLLAGLLVLFQFRAAITLDRPTAVSAGVFFVLNSSWYLLLFLIIGAGLASIGHFITKRIGLHQGSRLFDIAVGCAMGIILSTFLGLFGVLYGAVLGVVMLIFAFFERQYLLTASQEWLLKKQQWRITKWWELSIALVGMLLLGIYWIGGIKAFATGFDGSALYANLAQLIPQYHGLPGAYQAFGWSVVMSWGELLFGSTTFSLLLSQAVYFPALVLAYQLVRKWLKEPYALLLIVLVLSLPMVNFQAMVDEKVDFGLLFISLAILYQLFHWPVPTQKYTLAYCLLLGGLMGVGFSIKYTAIFLFVAVAGILCFRAGRALLLWSSIMILLGIFFLAGFYEWGNLPLSLVEARILGAATTGAGLLIAVISIRRTQMEFIPFLRSLTVIGCAFFLAFLPWGIKHLGEHQYQLSLNNFLQGKPDRIEISVPPELLSNHFNRSPLETGTLRNLVLLTSDQNTPVQHEQIDITDKEEKALEGNARREELQRYLGYEEGIWRYLSIPFDLTLNLNVSGLRHQEIGFIFLALFPLLLLFFGTGSWWKNSLLVVMMGFWIGSCFWSLAEGSTAIAQQEGMAAYQSGFWKVYPENIDGTFYQVWINIQSPFVGISALFSTVYDAVSTLPATIYLPLLLIVIFLLSYLLKETKKSWPQSLKELLAGLLAFSIVWIILGNGITWYAMLLWVLFPVLLFYEMQSTARERKEKVTLSSSPAQQWIASLIGIAAVVQIVINLGIVLSSSQPAQPAAYIYNWPMVAYLSDGSLTREKTYRLFDNISQDICNVINGDKNSKVYRVNTYLNYHIDRNDQRVYEDNQLQYFAELSHITNSETAFLDILKTNGINYLLYDINTPSLDQTPEQSLRKKCSNLLRLLLQSGRAEIVMTDNYVAAPDADFIQLPNGQRAQARQGLMGQTVYQGRIVLFKIN